MPIRDTFRRFLQGDPPSPGAPGEEEGEQPRRQGGGEHELALYKFDSCPYCRRVMSVIEELDLEDRIEYRDTMREPRWRRDLVEKTGRTQVPCLFIDGRPMFESADIAAWLRKTYA